MIKTENDYRVSTVTLEHKETGKRIIVNRSTWVKYAVDRYNDYKQVNEANKETIVIKSKPKPEETANAESQGVSKEAETEEAKEEEVTEKPSPLEGKPKSQITSFIKGMKSKGDIIEFVEKQKGVELDENLSRPELEKAAIQELTK